MNRQLTKLPERTKRVLSFINQYTLANGYAPSYREIGKGVGISSTSVVSYNVKKLVKAGLIQRDPNSSRAMRVVDTTGSRARPMPAVEQSAEALRREYADLSDSHARVTGELKALKEAAAAFADFFSDYLLGREDDEVVSVRLAVATPLRRRVITVGDVRRLRSLIGDK